MLGKRAEYSRHRRRVRIPRDCMHRQLHFESLECRLLLSVAPVESPMLSYGPLSLQGVVDSSSVDLHESTAQSSTVSTLGVAAQQTVTFEIDWGDGTIKTALATVDDSGYGKHQCPSRLSQLGPHRVEGLCRSCSGAW